MDNLEHNIDVLIVSTNSRERRSVFEDVVACFAVQYVIFEKVVFTNVEDLLLFRKSLMLKRSLHT